MSERIPPVSSKWTAVLERRKIFLANCVAAMKHDVSEIFVNEVDD